MKGYALLGGWTSAAAIGLLLTAGGCSEADDLAGQANCSASASGEAFVSAVTNLETAANKLKLDVTTACRNIAVANGDTVQWNGSGTPTDEQVTDACNVAASVIGEVKAAGTFRLVVVGEAKCEASLEAQADCTAECSGEVSCSGGDIKAQCSPANISGQCSGTCNVGAKCEGSPTVKVECDGSCNATCEGTITGGCEGTCDGTCEGTCSSTGANGRCQGTCSGTCTGSCTKPAASAKCDGTCQGSCTIQGQPIKCSGSAECTGGCSVEYTAPKCTVQATPPECDASAECKGSCQASAQARAECTAPKVEIQAAGSVNAALITALEAEIPKLLLAAEAQGKILVDVLGDVAGGIEAAVKSSAACALQLQAFAKASASINVSFQASFEASGSASGG
jgi:hypothetical protein